MDPKSIAMVRAPGFKGILAAFCGLLSLKIICKFGLELRGGVFGARQGQGISPEPGLRYLLE